MKVIIDQNSIDCPPFFWLHIRKSAGTTVKSLLEPHYVSLNTPKKNPPSFLQVDTKYWNDLINIPRVNLGEYNYKRSLFAKDCLYKSLWIKTYSFAYSREPVDRVISMFYYLLIKNNTQLITLTRELFKNKRVCYTTSSKFDLFLDWIEMTHIENNTHVQDRVFATHTAPMSGDVLDQNNNLILNKIFRLENLSSSINEVFESCNLVNNNLRKNSKKNVNKERREYIPNVNQLRRIREIYSLDFDIYENAE